VDKSKVLPLRKILKPRTGEEVRSAALLDRMIDLEHEVRSLTKSVFQLTATLREHSGTHPNDPVSLKGTDS